MTRQYHSNAFTLIELLVVIAIIGLLSSAVLASLSGARESARDTKRKQDLQQIQTALNLFYNDNNRWPTQASPDDANSGSTGKICSECSGNINAILSNYMSSAPEDPINDTDHYYYYDGNHNCGGHLNHAVVFAKTMETGETNRDDLKCSVYGTESGLESADSPYIILIGETSG